MLQAQKTIKARLTFIEPILGTASANEELHAEFIASKAPDAMSREEEIEAIGVEAEIGKQMTVFPRNENGQPIFWDYQFKGFFKDSCGALRKMKGSQSEKIKAFKKEIDGLIFVYPRKIDINFDGEMGNCQRPLRASTAQGERIALANSEMIPAGATCEIEIRLYKADLEKAVIEWLDYGELRGMGQWRNASNGRFTYELI